MHKCDHKKWHLLYYHDRLQSICGTPWCNLKYFCFLSCFSCQNMLINMNGFIMGVSISSPINHEEIYFGKLICDWFMLWAAKLLPFNGVLSLVGAGEVISTLKALQGCSVLVQGNWVLRSDILYPKDTISAKSGIPSDLMCRARDYLVSSSFWKSISPVKLKDPKLKLNYFFCLHLCPLKSYLL